MVDVLPAQRGPVGARLDWAWIGRLERQRNGVEWWEAVARARGWGRRPGDVIVRQRPRVSGRHPGRADHPLRLAVPARRARHPPGRASDAAGDHHPARRPSPHHHLGLGRQKGLPTPTGPIATGIPVYCYRPDKPGRAARTRTPTGCCASTGPSTDLPVHSADI